MSRTDVLEGIVEPVGKAIGAREGNQRQVIVQGEYRCGSRTLQNAPGYAARMFRATADEGINIELITTSEIRITCIINEARVKDAVRALHKAFEVEFTQSE